VVVRTVVSKVIYRAEETEEKKRRRQRIEDRGRQMGEG